MGGAGSAVASALQRLGITPAGAGLLGLAAGGWGLGLLAGGRASFVLAYGTAVLVAVAAAASHRRLGVEARRSRLPARLREGQLVEVEVELHAHRRVSTVLLEEELHPTLGSTVRVPLPHLGAGQAVRHRYTLSPRLRGVYRVGPLVATWSDPFGLTRRRVQLLPPAEVIVHPTTEPVHDRVASREWEDPPIRPPVSKPWPTGFEFHGMRDYVPGDDPRRIVWRATARALDPSTGQGRYLVRESEQGITDRVLLLLDTDARRHSPDLPSETFETAVRVLASLGVRHLRDGFAVTLQTNGRRVVEGLRGQRDQVRFLDHMARVTLERVPLDRMLERVQTAPRRDLHLVLVTPHLDVGPATRLRLLLQRGISLMLVHLRWEETDPASVHRAGALGCNVVEVGAGTPLEGVFRRAVGAGRRR